MNVQKINFQNVSILVNTQFSYKHMRPEENKKRETFCSLGVIVKIIFISRANTNAQVKIKCMYFFWVFLKKDSVGKIKFKLLLRRI